MSNKESGKYKIKKDKFTKARGGSSKFLIILCASCGNQVLLYQKDGPGRLLRIYLDKIIAPEEFSTLQNTTYKKSEIQGLHCPNCGELLAVPMIYTPENRLALRVIRGKTQTEQSDGLFPKE